jgi:hypothetical protein
MKKTILSLLLYGLPFLAFCANFTESRSAAAITQSSADSSAPMKVVIYKSRRAQVANWSRSISAYGVPGTRAVSAYVSAQAVKYGVNPNLALWIVKHESQFNPRAKGDGEASRGLWQISRIYHPEVPDAVAFNVASSTHWSLGRIRAGKANEWSTYHYCRTLYKDCPF